jgi:hypothetical protein
MMNQKIMFATMVAVVALVATAATAVSGYSITPAYAANNCKHDSTSSRDCFASNVQCERNSPGKSGSVQC